MKYFFSKPLGPQVSGAFDVFCVSGETPNDLVVKVAKRENYYNPHAVETPMSEVETLEVEDQWKVWKRVIEMQDLYCLKRALDVFRPRFLKEAEDEITKVFSRVRDIEPEFLYQVIRRLPKITDERWKRLEENDRDKRQVEILYNQFIWIKNRKFKSGFSDHLGASYYHRKNKEEYDRPENMEKRRIEREQSKRQIQELIRKQDEKDREVPMANMGKTSVPDF